MESPKKRYLVRGVTAALALASAVGIGVLADSRGATWPDARVRALWPTFLSAPHSESGSGGARSWDGSFRGCTPTTEVSYDYVCEYGDSQGKTGYICLAATDSNLSASSITAKVAPGDTTYGSASPASVCDSALAYALSQG
jgi:hypothetical protein